MEDDALALMRPADRVKEPAHAVKGIIGADEPPLEARVSRPDECRLKQKVGYGQHARPFTQLHCKDEVQQSD